MEGGGQADGSSVDKSRPDSSRIQAEWDSSNWDHDPPGSTLILIEAEKAGAINHAVNHSSSADYE